MTSDNPELVIDRIFDAPLDLVWRAWTESVLLAKWWGPKETTVGKYTQDFRVGGFYHYSMQAADSSVNWGKFIYREIVPQQKLVFESGFADEQGNIIRPPFADNWPLKMLSTITFTELSGKTKVAVRFTPLNATEEERQVFASFMENMNQGWGGTLERLGTILAQKEAA